MDFVHTLRDLIDTHGACEIEEEGASLYVHTWYLDFQRAPICLEPRIVRLSAGRELWAEQILHQWQDQLDHASALHWHLVNPSPPAMAWETQNPIHILIHQNEIADMAAALISVMDSHITWTMVMDYESS